MRREFTQAELEAYLDESLPAAEMAAIEAAVRGKKELIKRLAAINDRRDAGVHSLGEIWRRHRLSCPAREQLGSFLLGVLDDGEAQYVRFHLEIIGCRWCKANFADLQQRQQETRGAADTRRTKYFQSSAGYLQR